MKSLKINIIILSVFVQTVINAQAVPGFIDYFSGIDLSNVKETLYTLKPSYVEVDLSTQMGYLHVKDQPVKEFGVSTGTKWVEEGVNTNPGLFVVQSKMPQWHSRQFDSTLMIKWIGFNYGIGFHALATSGYYQYLGRKRSSHGCVRVSRETAAELYANLELGSPVLVHNGPKAVQIAFAETAGDYEVLSYDNLKSEIKSRINALYNGTYFQSPRTKLLITRDNVKHTGIPEGNGAKIARRQVLTPHYLFITQIELNPKKYQTQGSRIYNLNNFTSTLNSTEEYTLEINDLDD